MTRGARTHVPLRWAAFSLAGAILTVVGCRDIPVRAPSRDTKTLTSVDGLKGDSGVVRTEFRRELDKDQRVGIHLDLGRALEAQGNFEAAISEYQKAVGESEKGGRLLRSSRTPAETKALAHRRMAVALGCLGRFTQAEVHYREALRYAPKDARVWNDAGYSAYLQHRWTDAEQRFKTAARLTPDDPRIHTNLGLCLAAAGRTDRALEELSRAGGPAIGHANLAYILAALGKNDEARRHYQIALQFQPNLQPARVALAQLDNEPGKVQIATAGTADPSVTRTQAVRPVSEQR